MKTLDDIRRIIRANRRELETEYGLKGVGVFGSYVTGEQIEHSDIDLLVEVARPMGFVGFLRLESRLSQLLGVRAELVTRKALKPYIGKRILQEVQYVYGQREPRP